MIALGVHALGHSNKEDLLLISRYASCVTIAAAFASLAGQDARAATRPEFVVPASGIVAVLVNGRPSTFRVDPDFLDARLMNASVARSMNLKGSLIAGGATFGQIQLNAKSRGVPFSFGNDRRQMKRVHWFDRDVSASANGLISPSLLAHPRVRIRLRESGPETLTRTLPMAKPGKWGFSGGFAKMIVNGREARIGFALDRGHSVASAALGAFLTQEHGGKLEGPALDLPLRYGVQVPMRRMRLQRPFVVASLPIRDLYVRVVAVGLPPAEAGDGDGEEVVVIGKSKKPRPLTLSVGSDALARCSSLTFNNAETKVELTCRLT